MNTTSPDLCYMPMVASVAARLEDVTTRPRSASGSSAGSKPSSRRNSADYSKVSGEDKNDTGEDVGKVITVAENQVTAAGAGETAEEAAIPTDVAVAIKPARTTWGLRGFVRRQMDALIEAFDEIAELFDDEPPPARARTAPAPRTAVAATIPPPDRAPTTSSTTRPMVEAQA